MTEPRRNHYGVVLADPPWTFKTYSRKGKGRSAEAHYDCLSYKDLQLMQADVLDWAAKDCVLFMWATDPMLPMALDLISVWGFAYKTVGFYWAKTIDPVRISPGMACAAVSSRAEYDTRDPSVWPIGMGYWTRANPEPCLLATRGKPRRLSRSVRKLIVAPQREHSRKPDEVYTRIEALVSGPYLEMFSRFPRAGWDSWGNETGIGARRWKSNSHPGDSK